MLDKITPLILTFNEAPNIGRCLEKLRWAKRIVVVDSFSTDETLEIIRKFPQAVVFQRAFDSFAEQCNFGLQQIETSWVLSLDADYILSDEFIHQISNCAGQEGVAVCSARFKYCIAGKPLLASLYPPRTVLFRRGDARYVNVGHGHRVEINGKTNMLGSYIFHDDRKPFDRWLNEQNKYARIEAEHLWKTPTRGLNFADRVRRKIIFAPFLICIYTLLAKGLIFNGWRGWFYVFQRTLAEMLLSLRLLEAKLQRRD